MNTEYGTPAIIVQEDAYSFRCFLRVVMGEDKPLVITEDDKPLVQEDFTPIDTVWLIDPDESILDDVKRLMPKGTGVYAVTFNSSPYTEVRRFWCDDEHQV